MPVLLIRHKVADYDTWKQVFTGDTAILRANGSQGERHFRDGADPNVIWILLEWDDLFRARLFVRSDDLKDTMARAGVIGRPDYWYLEEGIHA